MNELGKVKVRQKELYDQATTLYLAWCQRKGLIEQQPCEAMSHVFIRPDDTGSVSLKNVNGRLAYYKWNGMTLTKGKEYRDKLADYRIQTREGHFGDVYLVIKDGRNTILDVQIDEHETQELYQETDHFLAGLITRAMLAGQRSWDHDGWTQAEKAMFAAGDAVRRFVGSGKFPTNNELETKVWKPEWRGIIPRDTFREVCDNLRHGFSPLGDG